VNDRTDTEESLERLKLKYDALREIAMSAARGDDIGEICQKAVENAVKIMGVEAGSLTLHDSEGEGTRSFASGADDYRLIMQDLEQKLISMLRTDFSVESLFLTLDRDGPHSLFSYPLELGGRKIGAISGVTRGRRSLSVEEEFIQAISSQLALAFFSMKTEAGAARGDIKKAKTEAIIETAVTLNHEINNPLTAVLGNVQLLLINRDKLDEKTVKMLESIETAALRIKEVTGRLMKAVEPAVTEYTSGIRMVDVEKSAGNEKEDQ
jgi:signal transduction histidine kinase